MSTTLPETRAQSHPGHESSCLPIRKSRERTSQRLSSVRFLPHCRKTRQDTRSLPRLQCNTSRLDIRQRHSERRCLGHRRASPLQPLAHYCWHSRLRNYWLSAVCPTCNGRHSCLSRRNPHRRTSAPRFRVDSTGLPHRRVSGRETES